MIAGSFGCYGRVENKYWSTFEFDMEGLREFNR